jgi:hypothetical protein
MYVPRAIQGGHASGWSRLVLSPVTLPRRPRTGPAAGGSRRLLHVLRLADLDWVERIGRFWGQLGAIVGRAKGRGFLPPAQPRQPALPTSRARPAIWRLVSRRVTDVDL